MAQHSDAMSRILTLQKKAMRIITFQSRNCYSSPLFLKLKLLKFNDKVLLENVLLVNKFFNSLLPPVFNNWFTFFGSIISITVRQPHLLLANYLNLLSTLTYMEKNSITINGIEAQSKAQTSLGNTILKDLTPNKIKIIIMKRMIDGY